MQFLDGLDVGGVFRAAFNFAKSGVPGGENPGADYETGFATWHKNGSDQEEARYPVRLVKRHDGVQWFDAAFPTDPEQNEIERFRLSQEFARGKGAVAGLPNFHTFKYPDKGLVHGVVLFDDSAAAVQSFTTEQLDLPEFYDLPTLFRAIDAYAAAHEEHGAGFPLMTKDEKGRLEFALLPAELVDSGGDSPGGVRGGVLRVHGLFGYGVDLFEHDQPERLSRSHQIGYVRVDGCTNLGDRPKDVMREKYASIVEHETIADAGVLATAQHGGQLLRIGSALFDLTPQQRHAVLGHMVSHLAGETHAEPVPQAGDVPRGIERCISGVQGRRCTRSGDTWTMTV